MAKPKPKPKSLGEALFDLASDLKPVVNQAVKKISDTIPAMTAPLAAGYIVKLRGIHDEFDRVLKPLNDLLEKLRIEVVPSKFENEGITSFTLDTGHRVTVSDRLTVTIPPENKPQAFAWLKKHKLGDLIIQTVNSQTLAAAARKRIEEGLDLPEKIFNVNTVPMTSITKTK